MNYKNFSYKIYEQKQLQNFSGILALLDEYKSEFYQEISKDKFVISHILTALRKTNNAHLAPQFIKEFNISFDEEMVLNSYGWCVYDNIKNKNFNLDEVKYILSLLFQTNSNYSYNVISNILRIGLSNIDNPIFLDFFDKNKLSISKQNYQGKILPSDLEKWYLAKTKQLFNEKKYQECFKLSNEALEKIENFSNFNDIWIARRIALSLANLGKLDEAIQKLETIYSTKKEWFILAEIAELYYKKGDLNKAFELAIIAINSNTKLEFKIGIITLLSKLTDENLSKKHLLLIKYIKQKNNWKLSNELQNINEDIDFNTLKKELFSFWRDNLPKDLFKEGVITKILHDNERGIVGFLKADKDYYFSTKKRVKQGNKVVFEIVNDRAKIIKIL